MTMYFVGIDISKYKHDCCIISAANQKVVSPLWKVPHGHVGLLKIYRGVLDALRRHGGMPPSAPPRKGL